MDETAQATPVLTNECETNRKTLEEAMRASLKSPVYYVADVGIGCGMIVMLVIAITTRRPTESKLPLYALSLFCAAMILFRYLFIPRYSAAMQMKRKKELVGTDRFPVETGFFDSEILTRVQNNGQINEEFRISYDKLRRIVETKNLIVLITKQWQFFTLDKAGFKNGSEEDFWRLVSEKCPEAKLKRR